MDPKGRQNMNRALRTIRYLAKSSLLVTVIGFFTILLSWGITYLIFQLTDHYHQANTVGPLTAPLEFTASVFVLIISLSYFLSHFKVALANGISRRTYILASLPAAALTASAFSLFNLGVLLFSQLGWPIVMVTNLVYPHISWFGLFAVQFSQYLLLILAGWFVALTMYRSSKPVKWIIALTPFALVYGLQAADNLSGGLVYKAIHDYLIVTFGLQSANPQPYTAIGFLLMYAALIYGLVFLLIRRAPYKG
jgi:hypothetical protein